jgi:hypothetical protein
MLTKTTITTNTNNTPKDELRDDWDASIYNAQRRAVKRRHATTIDEPDTAKRDALWVQIERIWFNLATPSSSPPSPSRRSSSSSASTTCAPALSARSSSSCRFCRAASSSPPRSRPTSSAGASTPLLLPQLARAVPILLWISKEQVSFFGGIFA